MTVRIPILLLLALGLSGCAYFTPHSAKRIYEERAAMPGSSQRMLVLPDPMDWHASHDGEHYGVSLPQGIYRVEADDADYSYYLAPQRISLTGQKVFVDQDSDTFDGGIFISRNSKSQYSAGAYIDSKNGSRVLLFRFDSRFTKQEDKSWHYLGE